MKLLRTAFALSVSVVSSSRAFTTGARRSSVGMASASRWIDASRPSAQTVRMMSTAGSPMDFAKTEIANNKIVVFSKSRCPFCTATKGLLQDMDLDFRVHELDQMPEGPEVQDALLELTGQRTVPNVFINGNHLGGNDDTQAAAATGKLQEMLG